MRIREQGLATGSVGSLNFPWDKPRWLLSWITSSHSDCRGLAELKKRPFSLSNPSDSEGKTDIRGPRGGGRGKQQPLSHCTDTHILYLAVSVCQRGTQAFTVTGRGCESVSFFVLREEQLHFVTSSHVLNQFYSWRPQCQRYRGLCSPKNHFSPLLPLL